MSHDLIDTLTGLRPGTAELDGEWSAAQVALRARLEVPAAGEAADVLQLTSRDVRRRRSFAPLAASVAVAAVAASVLVVVGLHGSAPSGGTAGGSAPADVVGPHQFAYEQTDATVYGRSGQAVGTQYELTWVSPDGRTWEELRSASTGKVIDCQASLAPDHPTVLAPTAAFLAGLPTDPVRLGSYLRRQVARPEISAHLAAAPAVDPMVSDVAGMLLGQSGLLTSRALRAALVSVAERLPGSTVDPSATDLEGRPAIRITRTEPQTPKRSGPLRQSAFYDPDTELYVGGKTVQVAHPDGATTASLVVRKVVDGVPATVLDCPVR